MVNSMANKDKDKNKHFSIFRKTKNKTTTTKNNSRNADSVGADDVIALRECLMS